jgi:hypothetical protein
LLLLLQLLLQSKGQRQLCWGHCTHLLLLLLGGHRGWSCIRRPHHLLLRPLLLPCLKPRLKLQREWPHCCHHLRHLLLLFLLLLLLLPIW